MIHSLDDWREQLNEIDAELMILLQRRMQLAGELWELLRSEPLTLGENDLDRLGIFLYPEIDDQVMGPLDKRALLEIFARFIREAKRLTEAFPDAGR